MLLFNNLSLKDIMMTINRNLESFATTFDDVQIFCFAYSIYICMGIQLSSMEEFDGQPSVILDGFDSTNW